MEQVLLVTQKTSTEQGIEHATGREMVVSAPSRRRMFRAWSRLGLRVSKGQSLTLTLTLTLTSRRRMFRACCTSRSVAPGGGGGSESITWLGSGLGLGLGFTWSTWLRLGLACESRTSARAEPPEAIGSA